MTPSILIAGVGNIFLGDDAFGSVVVDRMANSNLPLQARIVDFGIRGFDLSFELLKNYDLVIFIDAISKGSGPGSISVLEITPANVPDTSAPDAHGMVLAKSIELARTMGARFGKLCVIGCKPETVEPKQNGEFALSASVAAAVEPAIQLVHLVVKEFLESKEEKNFLVCTS